MFFIPDPVAVRRVNSYRRFSTFAIDRATASTSCSTSLSAYRYYVCLLFYEKGGRRHLSTFVLRSVLRYVLVQFAFPSPKARSSPLTLPEGGCNGVAPHQDNS